MSNGVDGTDKIDPDLPPMIDLDSLGQSFSILSWEETKRLIGEIVIEHQVMETIIRTALTFLISQDVVTGYIVLADTDLERMIRLLFAMFCHRYPEHPNTDQFRQILNECNQRRERRNFIVHSSWIPCDDKTNICLKYLRHKFGKPFVLASFDAITIESLKADVEKFRETNGDLGVFVFTHFPPAVSESLHAPTNT